MSGLLERLGLKRKTPAVPPAPLRLDPKAASIMERAAAASRDARLVGLDLGGRRDQLRTEIETQAQGGNFDEATRLVEAFEKQVAETTVSDLPKRFLALSAKVTTIEDDAKKLAHPPGGVGALVQAATVAQGTAKGLVEAKPADWLKVHAALEGLQAAVDKVNRVCLDEATRQMSDFDTRYKDKDKDKPAGKDVVAAYRAYGVVATQVQTAIKAGDGLPALIACEAVEAPLAAFEAAASPSDQQKQTKAKDAFDTLSLLDDTALANMSLQDQAELALELCANGTPTGSTQVPGTNPARFLPTPGSSLEQLCRLYKHSKPDDKFMNKRAVEREKIADDVAKMDEIKTLYKPDGKLDTKQWDKFVKDSDKVLKMMQKICDVQADAMGMARIPVRKDPDPPRDNGTMGGYNPASNSIGLNFHPGYLKPVQEAIDTIIHETFHAHQDAIVKKLKAGEIGPGDDDYATALMYMVNDIPVGYVQGSAVGSTNYRTQPTEFDSYTHAEKTAESVLGKAKAGAAKKPN